MESDSRHKTDISMTTQSTSDSLACPEDSLPDTCEGYGIASFLALCHRLELPFLSITWEARRGQVGEAGQARINQSLVNAQTSFVYKRFKLKLNGVDLRPIIQEVAVLTHPAIRNHPHIIPVQGYCWEIDNGEGEGSSHTIRPVLVFPKSEYGDLKTFFKTNEGRSISILDRLKLAADIGVAMRDMHANGIVHGDISNNNVLVFKATCKVKDGVELLAQVTDFGFSTRFCGDETPIFMRAGTRPWPAPESKRDYFKLSQMIQMDVYSYGLLCLWLLFGATSSNSISRPELDVQDPEKYISFNNLGDDQNLLEKWKGGGDKILGWAQYLVDRDPSLPSDIKKRLFHFFGNSLNSDPGMRKAMPNLVPLLAFDRENDRPPTISFTDWERGTEKLQIKSLVTDLYNSDFRVRISLATELEEILALKSLDQRIDHDNAALQLALCYQLGFINEVRVPCARLQSMDPSLLDNEIQEVRESSYIITKSATLVEQLSLSGEFKKQRLVETYREKSSLSMSAEKHLKQEIGKTTKVLRPNDEISKHWIVLQLMDSLADILADRGDMQAALQYREQVVTMRTKELGEGNPITLTSVARLASLYRAYGHYNEAARIQQKYIDIAIQSFPSNYFHIVQVQNNLAQTLKEQGELVQAEKLQVSTVKKAVDMLGLQHRDTFAMKGNLASIYFDQSKFLEAEKLEREVLKLREDLLGENHAQTRYSLNNLGAILSSQGRHEEAAGVQEESRRRQKSMYGEEEDGMSIEELINRGHNSQCQQQLGNARIDIERALKLSKTTWGEKHPTTLTAKSNLATLYQALAHQTRAFQIQNQDVIADGFLEKANTLLSEVNTARSTTKNVNPKDEMITKMALAQNLVAQDHPDQAVQLLTPIMTQLDAAPHLRHYALNSFGLARRRQGRLDEAEETQRDLVKLAADILGPTHRTTMVYLQSLAVTTKQQGRLSDAIALAEECYRRRLSVLGPDDDDTKEVQRGLQDWRGLLDTT